MDRPRKDLINGCLKPFDLEIGILWGIVRFRIRLRHNTFTTAYDITVDNTHNLGILLIRISDQDAIERTDRNS